MAGEIQYYVAKLTKIGSSCTVAVPRSILRDMSVDRGDLVIFDRLEKGQYIVEACSAKRLTEIKKSGQSLKIGRHG